MHIHNPNYTNARIQSHDLASDLSALSSTASNLTTTIPPEIISYVEEGRNPDIYTREFVELVQRSNQYLKGKSEAFATFRDLLAGEIVGAFPERKGEVKGILESRVGGEEEGQDQNGEVKKEEENHAG